MKNKYAAAALAFFLGFLGIHRYYLQQVHIGIWYTLFFLTGIPAIIAFVEGILFLIMDDSEFDAKYNNGQSSTGVSTYSNNLKDLNDLFDLKEKEIITKEEYDRMKQELVDKIENKSKPIVQQNKMSPLVRNVLLIMLVLFILSPLAVPIIALLGNKF